MASVSVGSRLRKRLPGIAPVAILAGIIGLPDSMDAPPTRALNVPRVAWSLGELPRLGWGWLVLAVLTGGALRAAEPVWTAPQQADAVAALCRLGRFAEAMTVASNRVAHLLQEPGEERPEVAAGLHELGEVLGEIGRYEEATQCYERALRIRRAVFGGSHPLVANALHGLGQVRREAGDLARAEAALADAWELRNEVLGPQHADTARTLNELALVSYQRSDYAKAKAQIELARRLSEAATGPRSVQTAECLLNLGVLERTTLNYARAGELFDHALDVFSHELAPTHPLVGRARLHLGHLRMRQGRHPEAEDQLLQALQIREDVFGPRHGRTADVLLALGNLHRATGRLDAAKQAMGRVLAIREEENGPKHPFTATACGDLAGVCLAAGDQSEAERYLRRAIEIRDEALGRDHPHNRLNLRDLACLQLDRGRAEAAVEPALQLRAVEDRLLQNTLGLATEAERLQFRTAWDPYKLLGTLGLARPLAETVLRNKGAVLDSLLKDRPVRRAASNPRLRDLPDPATTVTIEDVQSVLHPRSVLVEFIRYAHYLGHAQWQARYGAVVLSRTGEPAWVPLGPADALDREVRLYRHFTSPDAAGADPAPVLRRLHDQMWLPVARALAPDTSDVIISPDAALNEIAFATLLSPDGRFVGETLAINYVGSGRDLLPGPRRERRDRQLIILANPDFDLEIVSREEPNRGQLDRGNVSLKSTRASRLCPLPGATTEGLRLKHWAERSSFGQPVLYAGPAATETVLRQVRSPYILHLATHSLTLPGSGVNHNRLGMEGAVLLAGARHALNALQHTAQSPADADGILSAAEASDLDLRGTYLVVISGCASGLGEWRAGEGILGLRRGFVLAGAENLLLTLWPVNDVDVSSFMLDFYRHLAVRHSSPSAALSQVQREWLERLRGTRGTAEACRLAGPFILSSQGPH